MSGHDGWVCPKCGRVYAPWVNECESCNGAVTTAPWTRPWADPSPWAQPQPWTYPQPWTPSVTYLGKLA